MQTHAVQANAVPDDLDAALAASGLQELSARGSPVREPDLVRPGSACPLGVRLVAHGGVCSGPTPCLERVVTVGCEGSVRVRAVLRGAGGSGGGRAVLPSQTRQKTASTPPGCCRASPAPWSTTRSPPTPATRPRRTRWATPTCCAN